MSNFTAVAIERLATGTIIDVPGFGPAEVYECEFDGEGYSVAYCTNDHGGWDALDHLYVKAGETVEAFNGQTFLRADKDISFDEWKAKNDIIGRDIDRLQGEINAAMGYQCQPIDERPLVSAVAAAIGVPAHQAAE